MSATCPNCGEPAAGRYCAVCGQDNARGRLDTRTVFSNAFRNLLGWDSALARTLRKLWSDPGGLAADYVEGKRRRYVNPARFCLLALAGWFLITRLTGLDPMELAGFKVSSKSGENVEVANAMREFLQRHLDVLLYLALPLQALLLRLFFRRSPRNVAEALVLVLYVAGFGYLVGIALTPAPLLGFERVLTLRKLIGFVWLIRATKSFYGRGWFAASWRSILVGLLHMTLTVIFFLLIVLPAALLGLLT